MRIGTRLAVGRRSSRRKFQSNCFDLKAFRLVKQLTLTKEEHEATLKDNRNKQEDIKKMHEEIAGIERTIEKDKVQEVRASEEKTKFIEKFG